jgi:protein-disulfide isomerase
MSRKTKRNLPPSSPVSEQPAAAAHRNRRRSLIAGLAVLLVVAALAAYALRERTANPASGDGANAAALASEHAPTLGEATAKVHVVEFLDPACETCAQFYPVVKQLIAENPGRIRLSVRHVAFHEGADHVVRMLEASRAQDRYWETLEALLQTQAQWAPHHTVRPDLVEPVVARVGLDMQRLAQDMNAAEVGQRVTRDREDAIALKVTATPEYFVNGRPLPEFGYEPLLALVREELDRNY